MSTDGHCSKKSLDVWSEFMYSVPPSPSSDNDSTEMLSLPTWSWPSETDTSVHPSQSRRHTIAIGDIVQGFSPDLLSLHDWDQQSYVATTHDASGGSTYPTRRAMSVQPDELLPPGFFDSFYADEFQQAVALHAMAMESEADHMDPALKTPEASVLETMTVTPSTTFLSTRTDAHTQKRRRLDCSATEPISTTHTMSTVSPSPPITPPYAHSGSDPRHDMCQRDLQAHVRRYLQDKRGELTVVVLTSNVIQKSYGNEKRFLCPPPITFLKGHAWWSPVGDGRQLVAPDVMVSISGEQATQQQAGVLEWKTTTGRVLDSPSVAATMSNGIEVGKCVSKQLHLTDVSEKRKHVEVLVTLRRGDGVSFGTFQSKSIRVISKPSKKRQSDKNMELCIRHGATISLFNRIRSQTVSTKYLGVDDHGLVARTGAWNPFVIWAVDPDKLPCKTPSCIDDDRPSFVYPGNRVIHYNELVVLQSVTNGLISPVMKVCKVDRGHVADVDNPMKEPVTQLHKVAFHVMDDTEYDDTFLMCDKDAVGYFSLHTSGDGRSQTATAKRRRNIPTGNVQDITDHAVWTIVGTDSTTYTCWAPPNVGPALDSRDGLVPLISGIRHDDNHWLTLVGEHLNRDTQVWLGDQQVTDMKHDKSNGRFISCRVMDRNDLTSSPAAVRNEQDNTWKIPILLVQRRSGIIYATGHSFVFT